MRVGSNYISPLYKMGELVRLGVKCSGKRNPISSAAISLGTDSVSIKSFSNISSTRSKSSHAAKINLKTNSVLKRPSDDFITRFSQLDLRLTNSRGLSTSVTTIEDVVNYIKGGRAKSIVIMVGAGISTASGIPDFRSPGTGLYDNLKQYNIPYPEAIFDLEYFHKNPKPFFTLAKEIYPAEKYRPNYVHYFLRLLHEKNLLLRLYTQNIDGLERLAGIPAAKLVEAHGTFLSAACTKCKHTSPIEPVKEAIFSDQVPRCLRPNCRGIVKPNIVFFGEDLPSLFYNSFKRDFARADLLLVLGTSLEVEPFAGITELVETRVPRVLFNRDLVGPFKRRRRRPNDVAFTGDIVQQLGLFVDMLGWTSSLNGLLPSTSSQQMPNSNNRMSDAASNPTHHEPEDRTTQNLGNKKKQSSLNNVNNNAVLNITNEVSSVTINSTAEAITKHSSEISTSRTKPLKTETSKSGTTSEAD